MNGYGSYKWTCGKCGETYEATGVVGDFAVDRWRRDHMEDHRVDEMTPEEREAYWQHKSDVLAFRLDFDKENESRA